MVHPFLIFQKLVEISSFSFCGLLGLSFFGKNLFYYLFNVVIKGTEVTTCFQYTSLTRDTIFSSVFIIWLHSYHSSKTTSIKVKTNYTILLYTLGIVLTSYSLVFWHLIQLATPWNSPFRGWMIHILLVFLLVPHLVLSLPCLLFLFLPLPLNCSCTSHQTCSQQVGDPEESMVQFQCESRRADGVSSSLKASSLETQWKLMFQFECEGCERLIFQLKYSGRRNFLLLRGESAFLFYLGLQLLG